MTELWLPLDEWFKATMDEWDAKLPRALRLKFNSQLVALKAVELGIPRTTEEVINRYHSFFDPVRDAVTENLSNAEWDSIRAHNEKYAR